MVSGCRAWTTVVRPHAGGPMYRRGRSDGDADMGGNHRRESVGRLGRHAVRDAGLAY